MLFSISMPILFGGVAVLAVQWALAVFALSKLFLLKPKMWLSILLNVLIVILVIVGPAVFLIWYYASGRDREVKAKLKKLSEEGAKKKQVEQSGSAGKED